MEIERERKLVFEGGREKGGVGGREIGGVGGREGGCDAVGVPVRSRFNSGQVDWVAEWERRKGGRKRTRKRER